MNMPVFCAWVSMLLEYMICRALPLLCLIAVAVLLVIIIVWVVRRHARRVRDRP